MTILNGKEIAKTIRENIKIEIEEFTKTNGQGISLAVVLVGNNDASERYVKHKEKACIDAGVAFTLVRKDETISEEELKKAIKQLSEEQNINGILVQLPLPKHIDERNIIDQINPLKDVDGLTLDNLARIQTGDEQLVPCTPLGIIKMLEYHNINLEGVNTCIIGRSVLVGKTLASLFTNRSATVTLCHSRTRDLSSIASTADILVSATGMPKLVSSEFVKQDAVVIDVGINMLNGKLVGDIDFDDVKEKISLITPVPGGVGPMTIAMVLHNTLKCATLQLERAQ